MSRSGALFGSFAGAVLGGGAGLMAGGAIARRDPYEEDPSAIAGITGMLGTGIGAMIGATIGAGPSKPEKTAGAVQGANAPNFLADDAGVFP